MKATELTELHITKVAHAGNPAHTENDSGKKQGFTGAKFLKLRKDFNNDPHNFVETLDKEGFVIKDSTAEIIKLPLNDIEKDYYSQSGSINSEDGKKYISWTVQSTEEDPSNWIMNLQDQEGKPTGVTIHMGVAKDGQSNVQTVFFDKDKFDTSRSKEWLKNNLNLTRQGDFDMPITKEELGPIISESIKTELQTLIDRVTVLETKYDTETTETKTEEILKKERETLLKDISETMKTVFPELSKPILDRIEKIETSVVGSDSNVTKDTDDDEENDMVLQDDGNYQVVKQGKWTTPFLAKGDIKVVKKNKKNSKLPSTMALAIANAIDQNINSGMN